jgi:RHH-type transcriptional regulator, rel operon repressor / antitoxin RelB
MTTGDFTMLAVRLDPDLEARLDAVAKSMGRSKSYLAREALRDRIEELEDLALLEEALRDPDAGKTISHEQMKRELGLDT